MAVTWNFCLVARQGFLQRKPETRDEKRNKKKELEAPNSYARPC